MFNLIKLTLSQLESHLFAAADIHWGYMETSELEERLDTYLRELGYSD